LLPLSYVIILFSQHIICFAETWVAFLFMLINKHKIAEGIYCATNQKVAGSIPDGVIGNFH
jgi:hypothetical protein